MAGLEACVADDAAEFFFSGAVRGSGGADYVFFEHDGAYVVASEAEAELEDFESLGDPAGLDVFDVVEIEAGDCQNFEVVDGGGLVPAASAEGGVMRLEAPGDERGESAGFFLEAADDFEVIHALVEGFVDAEHHGGGGTHAELMGGAMDENPVVCAAFEAGDAMADSVVEDFSAAAGDGVEAGVAQADDGVAHGEIAVLGDGEDF